MLNITNNRKNFIHIFVLNLFDETFDEDIDLHGKCIQHLCYKLIISRIYYEKNYPIFNGKYNLN